MVSDLTREGYEPYDVLEPDSKVYVDRDYVFIPPIPADLLGQAYIRTANADKNTTGNNLSSFNLLREARITIALDERITTPPAWLASWERVAGHRLITTDPSPLRKLYTKRYPKGRITLGGNHDASMPATDRVCMYSVVIAPWTPARAKNWEMY